LELKDKGDCEGAKEAMRPLWAGVGDRPDTTGLYASVAAEVLLCVGILTGWIGSKNNVEGAQESAKNLITESITYYESAGDTTKVAAARAEVAYCYWREGALDEARIVLTEALRKLTLRANTRARAILKLATVEWSASQYTVALALLTDNASLFEKVINHSIKGTYHNQLAIILRHLAVSERRDDHLLRALREFEIADHEFSLAKNNVFRASVKNNVALILFNLSRFREANKYLMDARRLTLNLKDKIRTAQIDETRAQVLLAQGKLKDAETVVRSAISSFEKAGRQCLLAEALITHGIALARLSEKERAQFVLERAIEVAHQVGALNKAGMASLTLIEELTELPPVVLFGAYERAADWLADSQSLDTLRRLNEAARKIFLRLRAEMSPEDVRETDFDPQDLPQAILKYEGTLIRQALAKANGSVTKAAALLGISYQGLAYTIEARHKDLLRERTPIRRRSRKEIKSYQKPAED
jgi:tetratricopeptide (TPR) repeat protein